MPQAGSIQSRLIVPPDYYQARFKEGGVSNFDRFGQMVGDRVVYWGSGVGLVNWAVGQIQDDIEDWAEEKIPLVEWRHPIKAAKRRIKRSVRNFAWRIIAGAAARRDLQAWRSLPVQEPVFERVPEGEISVWEGKLERLRVYEGAQFDDAAKREVLTWLRDPQGHPELYESFLQRHARGAFDDQLMDLVESQVSRPFGIREDVLRRELDQLFAKGETITPQLFEQITRLKERGAVSQTVFDFLERVHTRQHFLSGVRRDLGWAEDFLTGRWKRKLLWRTPKRWLLGREDAARVVKKAETEARKRVLKTVAAATKKSAKAALQKAGKAVAKLAAKISLKAAWKAIKVAASAAWKAAWTAITTAVGLPLVGPIASKVTAWAIKAIFYSCSCLAIFTFLMVLMIIMVVGGAFHSSETGGGAVAQMVRVEKTANPHQVELVPAGSQNPQVEFKIKVTNLSEEEITGGKIVDDFDEANVNLYVLGGGAVEEDAGGNKKISWDMPSIPAGDNKTAHYIAFVKANDGVDKIVINRVTFTGMLGGSAVSDSTLAFVIVGNPTGQYPSTWPLNEGCVTQGPDGSDSHHGKEAIDIAPSGGLEVYATHDGTAYLGYNGTYGNYVEIVSPLGFISRYGHLRPGLLVGNGDQIVLRQPLGFVYVGSTGDSTGTHLHYEFVGLPMEEPYIPEDVERGCVGRDVCNFCF